MSRSRLKSKSTRNVLPARVRRLFWDYHPSQLTWEQDRDLIIRRVLAFGDWESVQWVHARLGDEGLRAWLMEHRGTGLSPRQLRFWELILNLPHRQVSAWLADPGRPAWDGRHGSSRAFGWPRMVGSYEAVSIRGKSRAAGTASSGARARGGPATAGDGTGA